MKLFQILMMAAKKWLIILINTCAGWTSNYRWENVECDGDDLVLKELVGLDFDENDDYVEIPHNPDYLLDDFTVEVWIKRGAWSKQWARIFDYSVLTGFTFGRSAYTNKLHFECLSGSYVTSSSDIGTEWTHIAAQRDGDTYKIYINGELDASVSGKTTDTLTYNGTLALGINRSTNVNNEEFIGKMRDARIWNTVRTQSEIKDNMNKELRGDETGLIGYWKLDEGTGSIAGDSSGNDNDGTITGATWFNDGYFETGERVSTPVLIPAHKNSNIQWEGESEEVNLVPTMTSNTAPKGVASASSILDSSQPAWHAFNRTNTGISDCWHSANQHNNWLQYEFDSAKVIYKYSVTTRNYGSDDINVWAPSKWKFQGSNNGTSWTDLDVQDTSQFYRENNTTKTYSFTNTTAYKYYRFQLTEQNPSSGTSYVCIGKLELFGEVTQVKIYTGISDSDEEEPDLYTEATNDSTIPDLVANKYLYCKQVLSTEDTSKTPKLNSLKIKIT